MTRVEAGQISVERSQIRSTTPLSNRTVLAIVLTHNAPAALRTCLKSIAVQSHAVDGVLIVDNASETPAAEVVRTVKLGLMPVPSVVREPVNTGPAGGYARALEIFRNSTFDLAWVMDDDAYPYPNCLEQLLGQESSSAGATFVFPLWVQADGEVTRHTAWCGLLLSRSIVEEVGLPRADYFWWAEDTEYLMWRIPRAGYPLHHCDTAVVRHVKARSPWGNPPWKYYYEARNTTHYDVWIRHRVRRLPRKLGLLVLRALARERRGRGIRLLMIVRGVADGITARLGQRILPVTSAVSDNERYE